MLSPVTRFLHWVWRFFLAILRRAMANGVTGTASQFAYNSFLATIPFMFVVVTAIRRSGDEAYQDLFNALNGTIPGIEELTKTFENSTASDATAGVLIIVFGVIAGLYVASNAIGALVDGLNRAQNLNHRPWLRGKAINFGFATGASIIAAVSTLALAGGPELVRGLSDLLGGSALVNDFANRLTLPVGVVTLALFTLLIYRFGPNGMRMGFRTIVPGAILSVAAWYGLTKLIGLYADVFNNLSSVYGALGGLFVYLTFLYFAGLMFLIGGELNAELVDRRLHRAAERDAAARTSVAASAQGHTATPTVRVSDVEVR